MGGLHETACTTNAGESAAPMDERSTHAAPPRSLAARPSGAVLCDSEGSEGSRPSPSVSQSVILGPSAPHDTTKRARPLSLSLEYRPSDPKVQGQGFKDPATGRQPSTAAQAPTLSEPFR